MVKTVKFKDPGYIGDPINAVRIFNEKEVDELIFLDIFASQENRRPDFTILREIASECFMPVVYGGGIQTIDDIRKIFNLGIEKVAINSHAIKNPDFIKQAADHFGSQSIVISLDARKRLFDRYEVFYKGGKVPSGQDPVQLAQKFEKLGAGEILLNSIDQDGTQLGYDIELIRRVSNAVSIPVIACGGAGKLSDLQTAVLKGGASACALGSMVVYYGRNRAVLINYPEKTDLDRLFTGGEI